MANSDLSSLHPQLLAAAVNRLQAADLTSGPVWSGLVWSGLVWSGLEIICAPGSLSGEQVSSILEQSLLSTSLTSLRCDIFSPFYFHQESLKIRPQGGLGEGGEGCPGGPGQGGYRLLTPVIMLILCHTQDRIFLYKTLPSLSNKNGGCGAVVKDP